MIVALCRRWFGLRDKDDVASIHEISAEYRKPLRSAGPHADVSAFGTRYTGPMSESPKNPYAADINLPYMSDAQRTRCRFHIAIEAMLVCAAIGLALAWRAEWYKWRQFRDMARELGPAGSLVAGPIGMNYEIDGKMMYVTMDHMDAHLRRAGAAQIPPSP